MPSACAGRKSILVVDDDVGMAHMARSGAYDLVLMDIQMAGLNGVQALSAMKAEGLAKRVIMMTAYTRDELVREAEKQSGFPVLPKPLDLDRVLSLAASATCGSKRAGEAR